jgi:membrane protein
VFLVVAFAVIALVPSLIAEYSLGTTGRVLVGIVRFVVLFAGLLIALAVLYRYAPDRGQPKLSWASPSGVFTGVVWILGSLLFSLNAVRAGRDVL